MNLLNEKEEFTVTDSIIEELDMALKQLEILIEEKYNEGLSEDISSYFTTPGLRDKTIRLQRDNCTYFCKDAFAIAEEQSEKAKWEAQTQSKVPEIFAGKKALKDCDLDKSKKENVEKDKIEAGCKKDTEEYETGDETPEW